MQSDTRNKNGNFPVDKNHSSIFPFFEKPKIIGYWSIDESRQIHWDSSQLRYYTPFKQQNVEYNLTKESFTGERKPEGLDGERSDHILRWIERNYQKVLDTSGSDKWLQTDFVSHRDILAKIMKAPYTPAVELKTCAAKWKNTIYLFSHHADEENIPITVALRRTIKTWFRFKFQQYMLTEAPGEVPDTSTTTKTSGKFCCVYQGRLNNHHLLYEAEVDGLCSDEKFEDHLPLEASKFIETRAYFPPKNKEMETRWSKYGSLSWWAKNYTIGIEDIVCGLIDENDTVIRHLEGKKVSDLQDNFKEFWNAAICMNFADEFLKFIKSTVKKDCDTTIYKFEGESRGAIVATEMEPTSEFAFLPDWYMELSKK